MVSFRKYILLQVNSMERGRIFTFRDLVFAPGKRANVAVILSEMTKQGKLVRAEKGAYYRPKESLIGLKHRPLAHQEKVRFLSERMGGYTTGAQIYNQMQLTEQVAMITTIATSNPVRRNEKMGIRLKCVKSYIDDLNGIDLYHLRLLDAIKDIKSIPGTTPSDVYDRLINYHFSKLNKDELKKIAELALKYPPRVRKILADILQDLGNERNK